MGPGLSSRVCPLWTDNQNSRCERGTGPVQIKEDHMFLILKVKETLLTTHEQKGFLEIKKGCGVVEFCPKATTVRP